MESVIRTLFWGLVLFVVAMTLFITYGYFYAVRV